MAYQDRIKTNLLQLFPTPRKLRIVYCNFFYYFWGEHCCCAEI